MTFARGGRSGRSLAGIYEDDQLVIFIVDNCYHVSNFQIFTDLRHVTAQFDIALAENEPTKE